ncbi:exophilin-5 [Gastrophryne carolinensis]
MAGPGGLDLSFLQEEEASRILSVLERDERLRLVERERLSKLQATKRDVKWLHAMSGEWFGEIQKKKFKDDPDVRTLVKPPLTRHLKKKTPKADSDSSRMSSSRTFQSQKTSSSGPSLLKFRSPLAALFSFRKSKQDQKPEAQSERHNIFSTFHRTPPSFEQVKKKFEIYQSARSVKQLAGFFEAQQKKANESTPSSKQLEKEAFQVLGDLDQKLEQEQGPTNRQRTSRVPSYKEGNLYSTINANHNVPGSRKEYSTLSTYDGRTTVASHTTHATYQPRRISDIYSGKHHSASKPETSSKNVYSRVSTRPTSAPSIGTFSSSSLDLPSISLQEERARQHKPRRIPVTSIKWNSASTSGQHGNFARPLRSQSAMDLTNVGRSAPHNRIFDLYKYNKPQKMATYSTNGVFEVNFTKDLTSTFRNNSGNLSTESYKTDTCRLRPAGRFPTQSKSEGEEDKENAFKLNTMTSQPSSSCSEMNENEEPMEVETAALNNGIVQCPLPENAEAPIVTSHPHILNVQNQDTSVKSELMEEDYVTAEDNKMQHNSQVDHPKLTVETVAGKNKTEPVKIFHSAPSGSGTMNVIDPLVSTEKVLAIPKDMPVSSHHASVTKEQPYSGLPVTMQALGASLSRSCKSSVKPSISNAYSSSNAWNDDTSHKGGVLFKRTKDIVGQFEKLNLQQGSNSNNLEGLKSDVLASQSRNATSLPDLIDQTSDQVNITEDHYSLNSSLGNTTSYFTNVSHTEDTNLCNEAQNLCPDNDHHSKSSAYSIKDSIPKTLGNVLKPYTFSSGLFINSTSEQKKGNTVLVEEVPKPVAEAKSTNGALNSSVVVSTPTDTHTKYRSMHLTGGTHHDYVQNGADNNNNRPFTKDVKTFKDVSSKVNISENSFIYPKVDHHNTEILELEIPANKTCVLSETKAEQDSLGRKVNQNLFNHLTTEVTEPNDQPKVENITVPTSQISEECLQRNSSTQANLGNTSTNLLKDHLLLAPEPFKRNATTSPWTFPKPTEVQPPNIYSLGGPSSNLKSHQNATTSPWTFPKPTEVQPPNIYSLGGPSSNLKSHQTSENLKSPENELMSKAYAYQKITENTQIFEARYTDPSDPDMDTIEYHKVVSIYYTIPRKYSRMLSGVSQNNLKNVDQTLENHKTSSVLLDKGGTNESEFNTHKKGKTSPSHYTAENVFTKVQHSGCTSSSNPQVNNFNLISLETNQKKNNCKPFYGEGTNSPDYDLVDTLNSLRISEKGDQDNEDIQLQRNIKTTSKYSPTRVSPRNTNTYYTLPNRKSSLQDLERSLLENDIAMARDRYNPYSNTENVMPTTPDYQDVFLSPNFGNDSPNFSSGYDSPHLWQMNQSHDNMDSFRKTENYLGKRASLDECSFYREDIPAIYRAKSSKDLYRQRSKDATEACPGMKFSVSPPLFNQPNATKAKQSANQTRPSYCSEFVQKKMKPINAKRFTFSFDSTGQKEYSKSRSTESFGDLPRTSDDLTSAFYSPSDDYPSDNRNDNALGNPAECGNAQSFNLYRSKSLKTLNNHNRAAETRSNNHEHFSSKSYGEHLKSRRPSSYVNSGQNTCNRTYSAETIIDENDNWRTSNSFERKPVCTSRSVDYGIFGKEQQEALLNNVKRSLTEGRLWRPSLLKNPGFLRNEEQCTSKESQQTSCKPDDILKGSLNIYEEELPPDSDSDSDTTTDDEYYLNENDKESEL